ncbi:MAG: metallophosphoesterase [Burkholderiales bacterium]|nr:metallophosphoesterase [Burkholderiales bacterium]
MRLQLLSDLHLESEDFDPRPAPEAELLVLAGDIDSGWAGLGRFAHWPVPVLMVAGNHEFDGRDIDLAWPALRAHCAGLGITLLERESLVLPAADGRRVRFVGTIRWSDFDLFGASGRAKAERAASYFVTLMGSTQRGMPFDVPALRAESLACRQWLEAELRRRGPWDATVAITHFAPSLRSADPRYGARPGTASFCNADDDLIALTDLWLHGHLHCRHDYRVERPGRIATRVICRAAGLASKGETEGFDPLRLIDLPA